MDRLLGQPRPPVSALVLPSDARSILSNPIVRCRERLLLRSRRWVACSRRPGNGHTAPSRRVLIAWARRIQTAAQPSHWYSEKCRTRSILQVQRFGENSVLRLHSGPCLTIAGTSPPAKKQENGRVSGLSAAPSTRLFLPGGGAIGIRTRVTARIITASRTVPSPRGDSVAIR